MATFNLADLTSDENEALHRIRRRKAELLEEIEVDRVTEISPSFQHIRTELALVNAEIETLDVIDDECVHPLDRDCHCSCTSKSRHESIGKKRFNMDARKGIDYLLEQGLIANTPDAVAAFLYKGEGLSKSAVGEYLGEKKPFNMQVLASFVALHDFEELPLVQALRQFLWSFRLPGEAQKIDRMMECFAQRYCEQNPGVFSCPDTCFILSFSVIMLNTSLHNPSVSAKDKPSLEQFISMNRGIDQHGQDLPRELLQSLYESIRNEPFKIPQDDSNDLMHTFFNPEREGWLWKQASSQLISGRYKSWKRRWFILNDKCLYYFEYTTDKEPRGIIPLENVQVRAIDASTRAHTFEIYAPSPDMIIKACKTDADGRVVEGKHSTYRMSAASGEEMQQWIAAIQRSINHDPFFDMLRAKRIGATSKA